MDQDDDQGGFVPVGGSPAGPGGASGAPGAPMIPTGGKPPVLDMGRAGITGLGEAYRKRLGTLVELTKDQEKRLKKFLKRNLEAWKQDTSELHDRLRDNNDLVEGVVEETDYPFEGASNLHVPVTAIYMKIFHSVERRSILGAGDVWFAEAEGDDGGALGAEVDSMINYKARDEWNIHMALTDVFWATNRDGLGVLKVPYVEEYEPVTDLLLITSMEEFVAEFPTPESAGLSVDEYQKAVVDIQAQATMETPVEIPITFDKMVYQGPKAEVVELVDFVTFPAAVPDIRDSRCKGYGNRFTLRKGTVKEKRRRGAWYKPAVDRVLKGKQDHQVSDFRRAQDEIEGITRSDKDALEFYEMVIKFEMERGEAERKVMVTYSLDCDEIVACMEYPYRVDCYALFRIGKRPNRLMGESIPDQTRDLNLEINTQHNQRIISRQISTVPSFKGKKSAKGDFDPGAPENRWRPGATFWLEDPEAFEQFKVQPVDLGESMQEERNDMSLLDLALGSSASLLSGQASTSDPSAPGNKTAMMINQSNLRMDDPLSEMRSGVETLGEICLSHLYQFGPVLIDYVEEGPNGERQPRSLHKKYLRAGVRLRMAGVTVADNPDTEMQKWMQLYGMMMQEPLIQQNPDARMEILRMALQAGRVANRHKILPSPEQIQAQQVAIQKQAMEQMAMEQQMMQEKQAQEARKGRMAEARDVLATDRLAEQLAERALNQNAPGEGGGGDAGPAA